MKLSNGDPRGDWEALRGASLRRRRAFGLRAREEQRPAVRERDVTADHAARPVARLIAVDHELRADRHGRLRDAALEQHVRAPALDHPRDRLAFASVTSSVIHECGLMSSTFVT